MTRRPQRCLLVTNIFPPQIGGPASFIPRLAEALAKRGHRPTVVCSSASVTDAGDIDRPFRVIRIHAASPYRYHLRLRWVLFVQLLTHRAVLINGLESVACPLAHFLGRRYVLKVVGDPVWETARNLGATCLDIDHFQTDAGEQSRHAPLIRARNAWVRGARLVVTPSGYLERLVRRWGAKPDQVMVIPNGVDSAAAAGGPMRRGTAEPLRVVFVGRLTNWKGVETLLIALEQLPDVHATVIGDGPELPHLVDLAAQLGVRHRVDFQGRLSEAQVVVELKRAHVLVLTSLYEGLSHTLLEAMALGVPCIASDRGGNPEVIHDGRNGLLIAAQDVLALRKAISRLADDEEARLRLSAAAIETAARFDLAAAMESYVVSLAGRSR